MFAAARKRAPSILFFDEVDAIGGSRSSLQSGWEKKLISWASSTWFHCGSGSGRD